MLPRSNLTSHWHSFSIHKFAGWGSGRLRMGLTLRLKGLLGQMLHGKWQKRQANHDSLLRAPAHVSPADIPLTEANPGQRHRGGERTRPGGSHGKGRGGRIPYKYGNWHPQVAQEVSLRQENVPFRATTRMPNLQAVLGQVADRVLSATFILFHTVFLCISYTLNPITSC